MPIESKLYSVLSGSAALAAWVSTRIYPIKKEQRTGQPSLVYRLISGEKYYAIDGGDCELENPSVELTIYATAVVARRLTGDAAVNALSSSTDFAALVIASPVDTYDDSVGLYTRTYSVSVWNRE